MDKLRLSLMRTILHALPCAVRHLRGCLRHVEQNCNEKSKNYIEKRTRKKEKGKKNKEKKEKEKETKGRQKTGITRPVVAAVYRERYQHSWSDRIMPAYSCIPVDRHRAQRHLYSGLEADGM